MEQSLTATSDLLPEKIAVGTLFVSLSTQRVLFNLRAPHKTHSMCWSLWGGMIEENEQPKDALIRELSEEMGFLPEIEKTYPFDVYQSQDNHFRYYSFISLVKEEFIPILNKESCGYAWIDLGQWPRPLHQGARLSFCNQKSLSKIKQLIAENLS